MMIDSSVALGNTQIKPEKMDISQSKGREGSPSVPVGDGHISL
jgi:hypothetical protein